jgi:hypothetical protein
MLTTRRWMPFLLLIIARDMLECFGKSIPSEFVTSKYARLLQFHRLRRPHIRLLFGRQFGIPDQVEIEAF